MSIKPIRIVFFGHHKCGSRFFRMTLLENLAVANGFRVMKYNIEKPMFEFETAHDLDLYNIDFDMFKNSERVLLNLSNAGAPVVERINALDVPYVGLHVVRDPRQLLYSNYVYHREGHKIVQPGEWIWRKLEKDRPILQKLPREEGIAYELENITKDILENQLRPWKTADHILEYRLEDFSPDPATTLNHVREVAAHCGFDKIPDIATTRRFANPNAQVGWESVLSPMLQSLMQERYGDLITRFGYA